MNYYIDIDTYIEHSLPRASRLPNRLALFRLLLSPMGNIVADLNDYRINSTLKATVTGQVLSLQSYLNSVIVNSNNSIEIIHAEYAGANIDTEVEGLAPANIDLISENLSPLDISLEGEAGSAFSVDFKVLCPSACNTDMIRGVVNTYKIAGKTFEVETF